VGLGESLEAKPKAPPREVVLPTVYYALLLAEAAGLTYYWLTVEVSAGDRVGHTIGWAGTASMCLMHVYSLRKRLRAFSSWGRLSSWLHVHIFLGLQGALFVCFHSAHLKTLSNISGATILCTLIVVVSGMFGRYLFAMLPRSITGERLSAHQVEAELVALTPKIDAERAAHPAVEAALREWELRKPVTDLFGGRMTLGQLVAENARTRKVVRHLEEALKAGGEVGDFAQAVRRRAQLTRKLSLLTAAERSFRYWHLLHKPLTFILLGVTVLHIVAHYIYAAQFHA
jgi:hypothetical protein